MGPPEEVRTVTLGRSAGLLIRAKAAWRGYRLPFGSMEDACVICRHGGPLDVIADLPTTWVTAPLSAPLPGYACVVSKRHVVEPFDLDEPEFSAFWAESMAVAAALNGLLRPSKMNYEIHGNTIPHLHLHLYPRFSGDRSRAVRRSTAVRRSPEDIARLQAVIADIA